MSQLLVNLNTVVSVLCVIMALHLFFQRPFHQLPVRLLAACFLALGLQAFFLGLNLSSGLSDLSAALQPTMPLIFGPLSYLMFKSFMNNAFRLKLANLLYLAPAALVFVLMLNQQGKMYADYAVLFSLLGYTLLLTNLVWNNKQYLPAIDGNFFDINDQVEKTILLWLLIFTAYSWLILVGDFLIFIELGAGKTSIQSVALFFTVLFKLIIISFTIFFALQKSPFFDWLYISFNSHSEKEIDLDKKQVFENIISSFEQLIREPNVYTQEVLSLKSMADRLSVPARAFSNAINHHYGESYAKRMNRLRIRFAENLLLERSELSVTTVMYESGFQTKSSFNKEFKALNGLSPSDYRQSQLTDT